MDSIDLSDKYTHTKPIDKQIDTIPKEIHHFKGVMQGKLIAVAYTLRTYWNQFSLGGICKQE